MSYTGFNGKKLKPCVKTSTSSGTVINEAVQAPWHVDSVECILLKQFPYHVWPHECSVVEAKFCLQSNLCNSLQPRCSFHLFSCIGFFHRSWAVPSILKLYYQECFKHKSLSLITERKGLCPSAENVSFLEFKEKNWQILHNFESRSWPLKLWHKHRCWTKAGFGLWKRN